jgi:hypothetical protein
MQVGKSLVRFQTMLANLPTPLPTQNLDIGQPIRDKR